MQQKIDVLVLGAGAAGLFCAAKASQRGRSVAVIDHANKAGKKILMSGGGRCNFTNYYIEPNRYLSQNPHFCKSALSRYTQWDFIGLVDSYGIPYHEKKDGQLFCDNKASDILNMLLDECAKSGANIHLKTEIQQVTQHLTEQGERFKVVTRQGEATTEWLCESLVVATGGPSIPTLGASGFGYDLARQFGLEVLPTRAGLVPFMMTDENKHLCASLSGSSMPVRAECGEQAFTDDMLFTHRGLSGPAMLQISSYWQAGDALTIDLLPSDSLLDLLKQAQASRPKTHLKTFLSEQFTNKFVEQWFHVDEISNQPLAEVSSKKMQTLAEKIHQWRIKPSGTEGYRTAEVALGGVNTDELSSKTLECKQIPGLFFIGEVVDVTGHLGGFNFQWAWSSAAAAAEVV